MAIYLRYVLMKKQLVGNPYLNKPGRLFLFYQLAVNEKKNIVFLLK